MNHCEGRYHVTSDCIYRSNSGPDSLQLPSGLADIIYYTNLVYCILLRDPTIYIYENVLEGSASERETGVGGRGDVKVKGLGALKVIRFGKVSPLRNRRAKSVCLKFTGLERLT